MARLNKLLLAGLISLGVVGCGEGTSPGGKLPDGSSSTPDGGADAAVSPDAPPAQAIDQAASVMRSAQFAGSSVRRLGSAIGFAGGSDGVLSRLGGRVVGSDSSGSGGSTAPKLLPWPLPAPLMDRIAETPAAKSLRPKPKFLALATQDENFDDMANDIEAFFKTRLFASPNIESMTMTSVTYLLKGDPTCRPLPSEIMQGETDRVKLGCAGDLAKLQVRIVVTVDGDGYRFQILLGPEKLELSVFIIHSDLVAWEADLNKSRLATQYANSVLNKDRVGEPEEPFPFSKLQGRIRLSLKALGEKKASVSWSVLEPIEVQDMEFHSFVMKAADPVIALTGDGVAETLTLKLGFPQTDVRAPWDPKNTGAQNSDLHVSVGGFFGESTLSEMADEVAFTGLGVGPSFVEVRTTKVFELGFNTNSANKMDLKVKPIENDQVRFTLSPKFDLSLIFKMMAVVGDYETDKGPESFMLDETYSILLAAEAAPVVVETVPESDNFEGGLKMVSGSLRLATTKDETATVNVPQGQCLTDNPAPPDGAHPLLSNVMSAACPAPPVVAP